MAKSSQPWRLVPIRAFIGRVRAKFKANRGEPKKFPGSTSTPPQWSLPSFPGSRRCASGLCAPASRGGCQQCPRGMHVFRGFRSPFKAWLRDAGTDVHSRASRTIRAQVLAQRPVWFLGPGWLEDFCRGSRVIAKGGILWKALSTRQRPRTACFASAPSLSCHKTCIHCTN